MKEWLLNNSINLIFSILMILLIILEIKERTEWSRKMKEISRLKLAYLRFSPLSQRRLQSALYAKKYLGKNTELSQRS